MSGILDRLRKLSGRSAEPESPASVDAASPRGNPWRGVFDPNSNPNMKNVGRAAYDVPDADKPRKTTWDYHLDAERAASNDMRTAAFQGLGAASSKDTLDAESLRKMFDAERVAKIMATADRNKDGKIDYAEFCDMLRKYPCD